MKPSLILAIPSILAIASSKHVHHHHRRDALPTQAQPLAEVAAPLETQVVVQRDMPKLASTQTISSTGDSSSTSTDSNSDSSSGSSTGSDSTNSITTSTTSPSTSSSSSSSSAQTFSYSIAIPQGASNQNKNGNSIANPYINIPTLPSNLVFIIVGAILALALLVAFAYRLTVYIIARQQAKSDKEVYYSNYLSGSFTTSETGSAFNSFTSSNSSVLEKNPHSSNSSIYLLQRQSSILRLQQLSDEGSYSDSSQPGRSYRDNFNTTGGGQRNSMFFSPVMDIMAAKRSSQLELPLHHSSASILMPLSPPHANSTESPVPSDYSCGDGYLYDSSFDLNSLQKTQDSRSRPPLRRPPSQYLDDLINSSEIEL